MAIVAKRRSGGATTGKAPAPRQGRVALVAAVLAVAALLAWWFLGGSRGGATAPGNVDVAPPEAATPATVPAPPAGAPPAEAAGGEASVTAAAAADDAEPPSAAAGAGAEPAPAPPARTNHVLNYRTGANAAPHIKSAADQIIAFTVQGADYSGGMPPLPEMHWDDGGNAMFLASLTNEIVVLEDDPPRVREQKEAMIDFRAQIKGIIDAGGTFEDAIQEYRDWVNECANLRLAAIREYQALRAEDPEAAEEYRVLANEELEAKGATPLPAPGEGRRRRGGAAAQ